MQFFGNIQTEALCEIPDYSKGTRGVTPTPGPEGGGGIPPLERKEGGGVCPLFAVMKGGRVPPCHPVIVRCFFKNIKTEALCEIPDYSKGTRGVTPTPGPEGGGGIPPLERKEGGGVGPLYGVWMD